MIDYRLQTAPFQDSLVTELHVLTELVFGRFDREEMRWKLARMPDFALHAAYAGGELVGFKAGYAATHNRYYSWLGGVREDFRRQGIARHLMDAQHAWAKAQ